MSALAHKSTLIISGLVLATALTTLIPQSQPELPGMVRLVLLEGPGDAVTQRAAMPLCEYLGAQLRRAVRPRLRPL